MNLLILNKNFESVNIVDVYSSFIWTDRFNSAGDFEIYLPTSSEALSMFVPDYYLYYNESDRLMIIEDIKTSSSIEDGNNLTVTGRSLESLLDRRIIWSKTSISSGTDIQTAIKKLINENVISPTDTKRAIPNFIFEDTDDTRITGKTLDSDAEYEIGSNLYDTLTEICEDKNIGFKITLDSSNNFVFKLYVGEDRSYGPNGEGQNTNPYIVFSPNFENIMNSEYHEFKSSYKNLALVKGSNDKVGTAYDGETEPEGLDRREVQVDADETSESALKQKGKEELKEYKIDKAFEGEVETSKIFVYGVDYFIGDIVELEDEYGRQRRTKVIEFIHSQDNSGIKSYPTFEVVDDDEE